MSKQRAELGASWNTCFVHFRGEDLCGAIIDEGEEKKFKKKDNTPIKKAFKAMHLDKGVLH